MTNDVMGDTIASALRDGSRVADGEPKRLYWGTVQPGDTECTGCGVAVPWRDLAGDGTLWGRQSMCYPMTMELPNGGSVEVEDPDSMSCQTKANIAEDSRYLSTDQYVEVRMDKCGLCAAEIAYDMSWLQQRLKEIPFPGEILPAHELASRPAWRHIWGRSGTGTSAQLALVVRHYVERGRRCLFVTESAMLASLLPRDKSDKTRRKTIEDFAAWDLLAIDKFGSWRTDHARDNLGEILERRAKMRKPTLFASTVPLTSRNGDPNEHVIADNPRGGAALVRLLAPMLGGWLGVVHLVKDHRPMPDMWEPRQDTTYQQRIRTQRRDNDPSPF